MTYRDLIFILCFVALGAWCWAGPITTPEPEQTPLTEIAPAEVKKQPKLTPGEKKGDMSWVHPKLAVAVIGKAKKFDDLVLSGTLLPRSNSLELEMVTAKKPKIQVVVSSGDQRWVFNSPMRSKEVSDKTVPGPMNWEVAVSSLQPEQDITELKTLFGKKPLSVTMEVFEASSQRNPMSRRVVLSIFGATSIPGSQ